MLDVNGLENRGLRCEVVWHGTPLQLTVPGQYPRFFMASVTAVTAMDAFGRSMTKGGQFLLHVG